MSETQSTLNYPYTTSPEFGTSREVAPGVRWLQMPLPMSLNHINLYLIEEAEGWIIVDTGIRGNETEKLWQTIIDNELGDKPISKIICTHLHPDHTGQTGFLAAQSDAQLYMSYSEYYQTRIMHTMMKEGGGSWRQTEYYYRMGFSEAFMEEIKQSRSDFSMPSTEHEFPTSFRRLTDGDELQFGEHKWQVLTGSGHSPEHVCLYCPSLRLLISGDQILPVITSNVSVHPTEPEADPMTGWIASHERFKTLLPNDILVLPAHNMPFYGAHERLDELIEHHEDRMLILEEHCQTPTPAVDLLPHLFSRKLEGYTRIMAAGECVAHLHCLMTRGRIERLLIDGVYKYRSIDPSLDERANNAHHQPLDETPEYV